MRDDFTIPNMGEAPTNFDKGYFNRLVRNIEMTFRTLKAKGRISVSEITADELTVINQTISGLLELANTGGGAGDRWSGRFIKLSSFAPGIHWEDVSTSSTDLYMNLDSGVFRFYSTSLGDGSDLVEIFSFDLNNRSLTINNTLGDGSTLLTFGTERSWSIRQRGAGGSAFLSLESNVASKQFQIMDSVGNIVATFGDLTGTDIGLNRIVRLNSGQIEFPATQIPSSGSNVLDDYEEGTWTPTLTFATSGDLAVTYGTRLGSYIKIGRIVHLRYTVTTTAFTHSTASGDLRITGVPVTSASGFEQTGTVEANSITLPAGRTWLTTGIQSNVTYLRLIASGSATSRNAIDPTEMPSGTNFTLIGQITYEAAN